MTNRIKTLLENGTPEWRSDLKLALLTLISCAAIVLFFSADWLLGAVLLKTIYFRYGMMVTLILLGIMLLTVMRWANIPLIAKGVGIGAYTIMALFILGDSKLLLLVSILSEVVIGIGVFWLVPPTVLTWIIIAIYSWKKGKLSSYLTEPLFIRLFIAVLLLIPACYAAIQHIQSNGFTVSEHKNVGTENYYSATYPYESSGTHGTVTVQYKCNNISILCSEVSAPKYLKEPHK